MNPQQEIDTLEELIDQLIQGIQDVIQSGEVLSDEFQGAIAEELAATQERIEQLKGEVTSGPISAPIPPDAELLWILSGQQEQAFLSYLRDFPSAQTQELLNNPNRLSQVINELSQRMPQGEQPVIDGIQHADLNSSNIWGSRYDPKTGKMRVRFQGGSEYEYDGVPANIYRAFEKGNASAKTSGSNEYGRWWRNKNPSLGAALNQYIKAGKFPYRKIR